MATCKFSAQYSSDGKKCKQTGRRAVSVALCVYITLMEGPCLSSIPGEFYGKNSEDGIQLKNSELWDLRTETSQNKPLTLG